MKNYDHGHNYRFYCDFATEDAIIEYIYFIISNSYIHKLLIVTDTH